MTTEIKTDTQIKKAIKLNTKTTSYPILGYQGLELRVRKNGTATFRHRYTSPITKKRPYMTLGKYPAFSLEQAKQAYNNNMKLLAVGNDPMLITEIKTVPTFREYAKKWLNKEINAGIYTKNTIEQKKRHVKYANAHIADMPIDTIKPPHLLAMLRAIEAKTIPTAKRVRGVCQKIFAVAIGEGYIENNPAIAISDLMQPKKKTKHRVAITDPIKFGEMLNDIDNVTDFYGHGKTIVQLMAILFQRSFDMCSMKWCDIDFDKKQWTFTPKKTGYRTDMVSSLIVPLPSQSIKILEKQYQETGKTEFVFYNPKRKEKFEHPQQLCKFFVRLGYQDIHCPHGFRASAMTMIQEVLKYPKYLPDLQQGHKLKDNNGEAYSRVVFLDERTKMMQDWANYLDELRECKINCVNPPTKK